MTVPASSITVQLSVLAHPTPEQAQVLERRIRLQRHARTEVWSRIRNRLGTARADRTWPRPAVLVPVLQDELQELTTADDRAGQDYVKQVVSLEVSRLRRLPHRVDWDALQPEPDLDQLSLPGRPFVLGQDLLRLPDLELEVDSYALPRPFREAVLYSGTERLAKWQGQLLEDLETWDQAWGMVDVSTAQRFQIHAEQCGQWCSGTLALLVAVPGVQTIRAVLHRRLDQVGERPWACTFTFTVSPEAGQSWFPRARIDAPVGIDPGLQRPLTWASVGTGQSLHHALVNLVCFPCRQGVGSRAVRRASWERQAPGYDRVWAEVLQHRIIRIEETHWATLVAENPDFMARARDNYLWTWLDHVVALAPLTGAEVEFIPSEFTSCTCSECGHRNVQRQQTTFVCTSPGLCGYSAPVDINVALNIAQAMIPRRI